MNGPCNNSGEIRKVANNLGLQMNDDIEQTQSAVKRLN